MTSASRVLVVAPHPDDESIGCGGAICIHVSQGAQVQALFLTSGERGVSGERPDTVAERREAEAKEAAAILGIGGIEFWREPDGRLRATEALVARLAKYIDEWRPERIYVTHEREQHPDHRAAGRLVRLAVRRAAWAAEIRACEIWTPLTRIDEVVDISEHIGRKLAAVCAHRSQVEIMRFDESCAGLARYRGEMHSWPGGPYAEVFTAP